MKCFFLITTLFFIGSIHGQNTRSTADFDFYLYDTLLLDPSQMELLNKLPLEIQHTLIFKVKSDGYKVYCFISGTKCNEGEIKTKKREGLWINYYDSSRLASKINYVADKKEGLCEYWYKNGFLNASGQYKNDLKEGEWVFYNKDGTPKGKFIYHKGVISE